MYRAPMPAASVGVNQPPRMPPRMKAGAPMGGNARRSAHRALCQLKGSPVNSGWRRAHTQTVIASEMVTSVAGMTAAANSAPVDTAATDAYTTAGMLGGMIGLIRAQDALSPTENSPGYPRLRMWSTSMAPVPAASARAAPLIHENPRLTPMFTYASPARSGPSHRSAASYSLAAILVRVATMPTRMNSGTASSGQLLMPSTASLAARPREYPSAIRYARQGPRIANAMGTRRRKRTRITMSNRTTLTRLPSLPFGSRGDPRRT